MTTPEIEARLRSAVTDEEARAALWRAAQSAFVPAMPITHDATHPLALVSKILNGPPAGWIGVGVLMVPDGWLWTISSDGTAELTLNDGRFLISDDTEAYGTAKRPDCALVLASLAARRAGGGDNGQG